MWLSQRSALVGLISLIIGAGVPIIACSSYGEEEAAKTPNDDASAGDALGPNTNDAPSTDGPSTETTTCREGLKPGVGPSSELTAVCNGAMTQLDRDAKHCGQCGHECGSECINGMCKLQTTGVLSGPGIQEVDLIAHYGGDRVVGVVNRDSVMSTRSDGTSPLGYYNAADAGGRGVVETALVDGSVIFASVLSDGIYRVTEKVPLLLGAVGVGAKGLAMLGSDRIVATVPPSSVYSISATTKSETAISTEERLPTSIVTDGPATVYWANAPEFADLGKTGDGQIVRYDVGSKMFARSRSIATLSSIAIDATYIYYFEGEKHEIRRLAKNNVSGDSELIATWTGDSARFATRIIVAGEDLFLALAPQGSRNPKMLARVSKCGGTPVLIWGGAGFGSFLVESNSIDVMLSPLAGTVGITR